MNGVAAAGEAASHVARNFLRVSALMKSSTHRELNSARRRNNARARGVASARPSVACMAIICGRGRKVTRLHRRGDV